MEKQKKQRLDVLLVEKGLAPSREKAKAIIMAGIVYVDGNKEDKAGTTFPVNAVIEIKGKTLPYVSRGGLKLEKAMQKFPITLSGKDLHGCRLFDRRIYRLYVAKRSDKSLRNRCRTWTACVEASQ